MTTRGNHFISFSIKILQLLWHQNTLTTALKYKTMLKIYFFLSWKRMFVFIIYILGNPFLNPSVPLEPHQT